MASLVPFQVTYGPSIIWSKCGFCTGHSVNDYIISMHKTTLLTRYGTFGSLSFDKWTSMIRSNGTNTFAQPSRGHPPSFIHSYIHHHHLQIIYVCLLSMQHVLTTQEQLMATYFTQQYHIQPTSKINLQSHTSLRAYALGLSTFLKGRGKC